MVGKERGGGHGGFQRKRKRNHTLSYTISIGHGNTTPKKKTPPAHLPSKNHGQAATRQPTSDVANVICSTHKGHRPEHGQGAGHLVVRFPLVLFPFLRSMAGGSYPRPPITICASFSHTTHLLADGVPTLDTATCGDDGGKTKTGARSAVAPRRSPPKWRDDGWPLANPPGGHVPYATRLITLKPKTEPKGRSQQPT